MTNLKAYEVHDGDDGWCITFATNSATARREGANELNTDWSGVEHCRRRPEFDHYAPGPVPAAAKIDAGWNYECSRCGRTVSSDLLEDVEDEGLDPTEFAIVTRGNHVYCSHTCVAKELAEKRAKSAAVATLVELVETKFSGSRVLHAHVCGHELEPSPKGGGLRCFADFTFPGSQQTARYVFGDTRCFVAQVDANLFVSLYRKGEQPKESDNA